MKTNPILSTNIREMVKIILFVLFGAFVLAPGIANIVTDPIFSEDDQNPSLFTE